MMHSAGHSFSADVQVYIPIQRQFQYYHYLGSGGEANNT